MAKYMKGSRRTARGATKNLRAVRKQAVKQYAKKEAAKETTLLRGIKQGAGMVVKKAFDAGRGSGACKTNAECLGAMCALTNKHLSLPRAVGSYTVVKTTTTINMTDGVCPEVMLFGPMKNNRAHYSDNTWSNILAVGSNNVNDPISANSNTRAFVNRALEAGGFADARMVPSAMTIQIMNPEALQTADGMLYIGRCKQVLDLAGDTRAWIDLVQNLVSYSAPRLCSAGKLSLRGVQTDAIPYNMSVLADFCPIGITTSSGAGSFNVTWSQSETNAFIGSFEGFAPIFLYNPGNVKLNFLVTIEWRARFDPLNPAYAGHSFHPVASDSTWSKVVQTMESAGHGVVDIASAVADFGEAHPNLLGLRG